MRKIRIASLVLTLMVFAISSIYGQDNQDRIIAGLHLAKLWEAVEQTRTVTLQNAELKSQIHNRSLSAIVLPKEKQGQQRVVRRCFEYKSVFDPDLAVTDFDYNQLLKYAENDVFKDVGEYRYSLMRNDQNAQDLAINRLNGDLAKLQGDERESSAWFAGALLADLEPTSPALASLVRNYREHVEAKTLDDLSSSNFALISGKPYSVGGAKVTWADLDKINPAEVKQFNAAGKSFRGAWVGSVFLLTQQEDEKPKTKDPTGLGLNPSKRPKGFGESALLVDEFHTTGFKGVKR